MPHLGRAHPNPHSTAHQHPARGRLHATTLVAAAVLLGSLLMAPLAAGAPGDGAWAITFDKVAPDPVESGVPSPFQLSVQCAALEAPTCSNGTVTIPIPEHIRHVVDVDTHPFIVGRAIVDDALVLTLTPDFPAGASIQVGLRFTAENVTTPNGYSPEFTATVTGDNTPAVSDAAEATFTATPALGITKRLPSNAPNGTRFPLDTPMRYSLQVCDTHGLGATGVLGMESVTVVDTLPAGATFVAASAGGVYDPTAGTVTWQLGPQDAFCYDSLTVDVVYETGDVDPESTVTNTVVATGRPYGTTDEATASSSVNHGFGDPVAVGSFCKSATSWVSTVTPPCGSDVDALTFVGPWVGDTRLLGVSGSGSESSYLLSIDNSSTAAGTVDLVDPVPCRTNSDGATPATYTSNAPGDICTDPAWIVTGFRSSGAFPGNGFHQAIEAENFPTYVTTTGQVRAFVAHPATGSAGALQWLFTPQPGDVVAEIRWADVPAPVGTGGRGSLARVHGYLASDLDVGDRVTNVAERTLTVGGSALTGSSRASLVAIDETVVRVLKSVNINGTFSISAGAVSPSQSRTWGSGLVITDLLPVELQAVTLAEARYSRGDGSPIQPMPASAYRLEQIPDYQGSGRTLVRFTVPAGVDLGAVPTAVLLRFAPAGGGGFPWIGTRVNTTRVFTPGHDIDRCVTSSGSDFTGGNPAATDDTLDWDGDGLTVGDSYCSSSANLTRPSSGAAIAVTKQVRGNLDTTYAAYPKVALTDPSLPGDAGYRVTVRNSGGANLSDVVLYDVLPRPGDTGVSAGQVAHERGSTFSPVLTGPVTVNGGGTWEVAYSTAVNPCRPEVGDGSASWPAGCTDDWTTSPPGDLSTVTALRFRLTGGLLTADTAATNAATFTWPMTAPASADVGDVAWNSTATTAVNDATGAALLTTEPPKVGLAVPQSDVELTKTADLTQAALGETVTYTVTATHGTTIVSNPDGTVSYVDGSGAETTAVAPATGVEVTDVLPTGMTLVPGSVVAQQGTFDPDTGIWTLGTIEVGGSVTLTYRARIDQIGAHVNRAEVSAESSEDVDSTPGNCGTEPSEDDCAAVTVTGAASGITLDKLVESGPGSSVFLHADEGTTEHGTYPSGTAVTYRFVVTNVGLTDLADVTIDDPTLPFFCDTEFQIGALAAGEEVVVDCTWPVGYGTGTTVNTAGVSAASPGGETLQASDTAQVLVPSPALALEKHTNGFPAQTPSAAVPVSVGDTVTWTYTLRNTGDDALTELTLTDDREAGVTLDEEHCVRTIGAWGDPLPPAATITCTFTGTAEAGLYANTATATGRGVTTPLVVSAADLSHYTTEPRPTVTGATVGDYVWVDADRDGRQDPGEPGIPGVVLSLLGPDGQPVTGLDENPLGQVTTGAKGRYSFDKLPVLSGDETYTVRIDRGASAAPLEPYAPTLPGQGGRDGDSSTWKASTEPGDLHDDGDHDRTLDFGFVTKTGAGGDVEGDDDSGEVDGPTGYLPDTGNPIGLGLLLGAFALLGAGGLLLLIGRRDVAAWPGGSRILRGRNDHSI